MSIPCQASQKLKIDSVDYPRHMLGTSDEAMSPVYVIGRSILRPALRLRYRPKISGTSNMPVTGPVLIVSNHLSGIDTILIPCFSPRPVRFLAKASLFRTPFRNWLMRAVGAVPVFRAAGSEAQAALEAGKSILTDGNVFAIFPEGSRSRNGLLNKGRTGAAWLALETGATILPVGLIGTDRRDGKGRRPRMEMRIGTPFTLADLTDLPGGRARREATERIMRSIQDLTGQERTDDFAEGSRGA